MTGKDLLENDPTLREIVRRIVEGWHPERIILLGSRARGEANQHGDYDLLVVMPYEASSHSIAGEMYRAMIGVGASQDILLTTPEEYDWRQHVAGTIEHEAARDGLGLYEEAARVGTRATGHRRMGRQSARWTFRAPGFC